MLCRLKIMTTETITLEVDDMEEAQLKARKIILSMEDSHGDPVRGELLVVHPELEGQYWIPVVL